jgi:hypothetical protein
VSEAWSFRSFQNESFSVDGKIVVEQRRFRKVGDWDTRSCWAWKPLLPPAT